ncbi:CBS domain-containing protein [Paraburkholderia tagetis]|uniref:CBS domain-containing protein n=1 Tax=Paraburkholderia tagetis TaxID=2913261 RepID=A0A9X1UHY3_9BURK|nr:CBS domain-containing protein [Paraburkholderia tagetis]MCG5076915.1 CBS domain-containing protein [Paraburkholderia tagetis]
MTIHEAARTLAGKHISYMSVVDATGKLVGTISESNLLHRAEIGTESKRRGRWSECARANSPANTSTNTRAS